MPSDRDLSGFVIEISSGLTPVERREVLSEERAEWLDAQLRELDLARRQAWREIRGAE